MNATILLYCYTANQCRILQRGFPSPTSINLNKSGYKICTSSVYWTLCTEAVFQRWGGCSSLCVIDFHPLLLFQDDTKRYDKDHRVYCNQSRDILHIHDGNFPWAVPYSMACPIRKFKMHFPYSATCPIKGSITAITNTKIYTTKWLTSMHLYYFPSTFPTRSIPVSGCTVLPVPNLRTWNSPSPSSS